MRSEKYSNLVKNLSIQVKKKSLFCPPTEFKDTKEESKGLFAFNYKLLRFLGEGAHCAVYLGESVLNKSERYAIKVFRTEDEELINMIIRTYKIQQMANQCKHVARAFDLFINRGSGVHHLVMEYSPLPTLQETLDNLNHISVIVQLQIIRNLAEAIQFLHSKRICHRDIKPDNVLVNTKNGEIKLLDFGVSIIIPGSNKLMMTPTGNVRYRAPEIESSLGYNESIDIWALGMLSFKMATRYLPDASVPIGEYTQQKEAADLNPLHLDLIMRMLEPDQYLRINAEEIASHQCFGDPELNDKCKLEQRSRSSKKSTMRRSAQGRHNNSSFISSPESDSTCSPWELKKTILSKIYQASDNPTRSSIQFLEETSSPQKCFYPQHE